MDKPKSLALAWEVQRRNKSVKKIQAPVPMKVSPKIEPSSIADAIMAKRKEASPLMEEESNDGYGEPLPMMEEKEVDISESPEPLPFPTSRADAIRMKLKANRE